MGGYPPFNGNNDAEIMRSVELGKFDFPVEDFGKVSAKAQDLITNMLAYKPESRFSIENSLNHSWIKEYSTGNKANIPELQNALQNMKKFRVNFNKKDKAKAAGSSFNIDS